MILSPARRITVVIVSWQVRELLRLCLASIESYKGQNQRSRGELDIDTIVIDNASQDHSVEMIQSEFPAVKLIANKVNRGFGAACNQGWRLATGDIVLFLNPDCELIGDALGEVCRFMSEQPHVGIVGPRLEHVDGRLQHSCRRWPTIWSSALILLKLHRIFPMCLPLRRYYMWAFRYATLREVDQVMGACMFMRRSLLENLNGFDERYFLWFEDVDICRRAKGAGWIIFFYPWATVRHNKSSSFGQRRPVWRQWYFAQSCRRYFRNHHSLPASLFIGLLSWLSLGPAIVAQLLLMAGLKPPKDEL